MSKIAKIIDLLIINNYFRIIIFIILIIKKGKKDKFIYQYNFNIIMTPENKDQDIFDKEIYKTRTFTFELSCNESGKDLMLVKLHTFLNRNSLAFNNLRAYDSKLKIEKILYTEF